MAFPARIYDAEKIAFIRGAFCGSGTISRPGKPFHMEYNCKEQKLAKYILKFLRKMEFSAGLSKRNENYVVYLKEGESIIELLGLMGAVETAERLEAARNYKEVKSQVNRVMNAESSNIKKAAVASNMQLKDIKALLNSGYQPTGRMQEIIEARRENPEATLKEIGEIVFLAKPSVEYWFLKIHRMVEELQGKKK